MRVAVAALLISASSVLATEPDVASALEELAHSPSRVVLYSLAPHPDPSIPVDQSFHSYQIRGRADVTEPAERQALLRALARGAREANPNVVGACFNPRHGLRIEKGSYAADFIICFECLQVEACGLRVADGFRTSTAPQVTFDESLRRHNLPLPQK